MAWFADLSRGYKALLAGLVLMFLMTGSGGLRLIIEALRIALDPARTAEGSSAFFMGMSAVGMVAFSIGFAVMTAELVKHLKGTA